MGAPRRVDRWELVVSLETHFGRIERRPALVVTHSARREAGKRVTDRFRFLNGHDPLRFDFPLYRLGISNRLPSFGLSPELLKV